MKTYGSIAAVVAAIHDEAAAEIERLEADRAQERDRIRQAERTAPVEPADRDRRLGAARRKARESLARAKWEGSKERLEARERWMQHVAAEGRVRLRQTFQESGRRAWLAHLATEAIARLPGNRFVVCVAREDAALLDATWQQMVGNDVARPDLQLQVVEGDHPADGCIVRTVDGKITLDNSVEARSRRFEADWRAALGGLYDAAVADAAGRAS